MAVYLDCNATTPLEEAVLEAMMPYWISEYGNAGSRTHEFGVRAKRAVQDSREKIAAVVAAGSDEVVFTSGATESNNLALLGLREFGERTGRRHIVTTEIEHKAVLEPLEHLATRGFEVTLVPPTRGGTVDATAVLSALRPDTLAVSVMQANNETGVLQPISQIAEGLLGHDAYFHVDAAQGFGKELSALRHKRVDFISVSGHKIYGPKGIGALIARRRGFKRPPLTPLSFGGGQEAGLRPGTLPVPLIVGLGEAAKLALRDHSARRVACIAYRDTVLAALSPLQGEINGDSAYCLPHVLNISFRGIDSEALMVALKPFAAISNGSACTSSSYQPSHVLAAMRVPDEALRGAIRVSWCHMTVGPDWQEIEATIGALR